MNTILLWMVNDTVRAPNMFYVCRTPTRHRDYATPIHAQMKWKPMDRWKFTPVLALYDPFGVNVPLNCDIIITDVILAKSINYLMTNIKPFTNNIVKLIDPLVYSTNETEILLNTSVSSPDG